MRNKDCISLSVRFGTKHCSQRLQQIELTEWLLLLLSLEIHFYCRPWGRRRSSLWFQLWGFKLSTLLFMLLGFSFGHDGVNSLSGFSLILSLGGVRDSEYLNWLYHQIFFRHGTSELRSPEVYIGLSHRLWSDKNLESPSKHIVFLSAGSYPFIRILLQRSHSTTILSVSKGHQSWWIEWNTQIWAQEVKLSSKEHLEPTREISIYSHVTFPSCILQC